MESEEEEMLEQGEEDLIPPPMLLTMQAKAKQVKTEEEEDDDDEEEEEIHQPNSTKIPGALGSRDLGPGSLSYAEALGSRLKLTPSPFYDSNGNRNVFLNKICFFQFILTKHKTCKPNEFSMFTTKESKYHSK
jgi:hypothetical protein